MSIRVDNRYIYKYLNEQHERDHARTIGEVAKNKRKEIPFLATLFTGAALVILCLGFALYFANSYKKISENNGYISEFGTFKKEFSDQRTNTDEVINIDDLLSQIDDQNKSLPIDDVKEIQNLSNNNLLESNTNTVRDYVIFDYINFDNEDISRVVVGRQYDDPSSGMTSAWCYVESKKSGGIKNTLYLVNVSDQRTEAQLTDDIAKSFGTSLQTLIEAKSKCTI